MLSEGRSGEVRTATGSLKETRLGPYGQSIVDDSGLGRYFESARLGRTFLVANTAVQALSLGSATATGLVLSNTLGSGKALVLLQASFAPSLDQTADTAVALFLNDNISAAAVVHTTPITTKPAACGAQFASVGKADSAATLPATPTLIRPMLGGGWATAAGFSQTPAVIDPIDGALILLPNTAVSIQALTTAITGLCGFVWAEVDWPL